MMVEDYVSFEVAKLLKEKGFDEKCISVYHDGELRLVSSLGIFCGAGILAEQTLTYTNSECEWSPIMISAPTLQMATKWLRKAHNLHCVVDYDFVLGWYCQITSLKETVEYDYEEMKHYHPEKDNGFSSPEEACEEAIKYCLEKLI